VLLDLELPDGDGVERLPELKAAASEATFLVVSRHDTAAIVKAARERGADGFLQKGLPDDEFADSLRKAIFDDTPIWPQVENATGLTKREIHALHIVDRHKSDKEAARVLDISPETLRGHLKRIFRKLDVHTRAEAISEARKLKLIP
jgi:DNA-binding NarL/FixJ family response regulator